MYCGSGADFQQPLPEYGQELSRFAVGDWKKKMQKQGCCNLPEINCSCHQLCKYASKRTTVDWKFPELYVSCAVISHCLYFVLLLCWQTAWSTACCSSECRKQGWAKEGPESVMIEGQNYRIPKIIAVWLLTGSRSSHVYQVKFCL